MTNLILTLLAFPALLPFLATSIDAFTLPAIIIRSGPRGRARTASSSLSSSSSSPSSLVPLDVSSYMSGPTPEGTGDFIMQQTMIRVKDPRKSLDFYCNVLGFKLIHYSEVRCERCAFPSGSSTYTSSVRPHRRGRSIVRHSFVLVMKPHISVVASHACASDIAPVSSAAVQPTPASRRTHCMNTPGCIELTWNYGTENEDGRVYNTGNADGGSRGGFGHVGIAVPNVYEACERFRDLGVEFHKSPNSGGMKGLAFVRDPDGYLIEVLPRGEMIVEAVDCMGVALEGDGTGYVDNGR
ncbi:hypothetical protein ACHAW5_004660 [Stephanodiscus triporus]|uniref:VOC domain-containing protein n=1 Tax=Stephanodiscus triporus TaxID=2934178 RepID=A0ABD3MHU3_9STRA